jgi:hypothetical protein
MNEACLCNGCGSGNGEADEEEEHLLKEDLKEDNGSCVIEERLALKQNHQSLGRAG